MTYRCARHYFSYAACVTARKIKMDVCAVNIIQYREAKDKIVGMYRSNLSLDRDSKY